MSLREEGYRTFLTVAGSDSCGGAGLQSDIKTAMAYGLYAASVVTCVTAQNSTGIRSVVQISASSIRAQLQAVMEDFRPDVIKVGMTGCPEAVKSIAQVLKEYPHGPVVTDPILSSTMSGEIGNISDLIESYREFLIPQSDILTPNLAELIQLSDSTVKENEIGDNDDALICIASDLEELGCRHILATGSGRWADRLVSFGTDGTTALQNIESIYVDTPNLHGTGCVFSSALACSLVSDYSDNLLSPQNVYRAAKNASEYLHIQLEKYKALRFGQGYGPAGFFIDV
ncbi:MAG: hydroxymethylpyrimidine/phosphomethylpyrimidine kinase [Muribaculum sp.]|nr:hydroxymethylpyrimidine/phosphomethylpyrimidine kinase [Muribaculum sp.]